MSQLSQHMERAAGTGRAMAFAGLGHDLETVRMVAAELTISWTQTPDVDLLPLPIPQVHRPAGYGLLVALSREIRGR